MPQTVSCGGDDGACGGGGGGCADVPQTPSIGDGGSGAEAAVDDEEVLGALKDCRHLGTSLQYDRYGYALRDWSL